LEANKHSGDRKAVVSQDQNVPDGCILIHALEGL
jgi:hypothetical protein